MKTINFKYLTNRISIRTASRRRRRRQQIQREKEKIVKKNHPFRYLAKGLRFLFSNDNRSILFSFLISRLKLISNLL